MGSNNQLLYDIFEDHMESLHFLKENVGCMLKFQILKYSLQRTGHCFNPLSFYA